MRRTLTSIAVILAAVLLPFSVEAASQITAADSIAGLGVTVTLTGLPPAMHGSLTVIDPQSKVTQLPLTADSHGNATVNIASTQAEEAGTYTLSVTLNGLAVAGPTTVAVLPDTMDAWASSVQAWTPHIGANGNDSADITVTMRDKYGNMLPGRPVALVSSRPQDVITQLTPSTDKDGTQHFSLTTTLPGQIQIRAVDLLSGNTLSTAAQLTAGSSNTTAMGGSGYGGQQFYGSNDSGSASAGTESVGGRQFYAAAGDTFDVIQGFNVTMPGVMQTGQEAQKITVRAVDKNGNTVQNYVGTVVFESTDPQATLPNFGTYSFQDRDLGAKSFPLVLTFQTPGQQIFRVKDQNNPALTGQANVNVTGSSLHGSANGIQVTSYKDGDKVNKLDIVISGIGPAYANLIVSGGTQAVTGSSDGQGNFSIPITLDTTQKNFTVAVRDDAGRNDSGPIHLTFDNTGPVIGKITFSPANPDANEKVLVVVQSDPGVVTFTMKITDATTNNDQTIPLIATASNSGSYQAFFNAPSVGVYQPDFAATDKSGNTTDVRTSLSVGLAGLPTVMNVQVTPQVNAVAMTWDNLTGPLDGYRIYVGDSPTNFIYTLDTGRVTNKATIAGLTPGKTYYFAVTALKGTLESKDKSNVVAATSLGIALTVTPGDGTLDVTWPSLQTDLPLSSFLLEYGVQPGTYTETRMLNGSIRDYVIHDLVNGFPYYIRLTPITVTGDKLSDLAAKGEGTPNGSGFHAGPQDAIPGNLGTNPGNTQHPATELPSNGLPAWMWMSAGIIGMLGAVYGWHKRQTARHTAAFLAAMEAKYREL